MHIECTGSGPAAIIADIHQAQLIDPYLTGLQAARYIAHTDHHGLHLAQRRITHDADAVVQIVRVIVGELHRVTGRPQCARLVTRLLQGSKQ